MYRKCNAIAKDTQVAFENTFSKIFEKEVSFLSIPVSSVLKLPSINMKIGSQIKYYRKLKGLTQKELGEVVGISKWEIARIENNEILSVKFPLLDKLINYLDIEDKIVYDDDYIRFIKNNPAAQIKAYRKKENITMYQLSDILNISYTTVKKWEKGKSIISRKCYEKLKQLLNED